MESKKIDVISNCIPKSVQSHPSDTERKSDRKVEWLHSRLADVIPFLILMMIASLVFTGVLSRGVCIAASNVQQVHIGSELDFPPYAFTDKNGEITGFSIELVKAVSDAMGLSIKISTGSWDAMWNALAAGQLDVLPIVAKSPERQLRVDFSLPHTETYDAFFVRKGDSPINTIADAQGKEIVVMRSDAAHHELLARNFQKNLIFVDTITDGLRLISSGKHNALLCSKLIGTLLIKEQGLRGLTVGPPIADYKRVFSFAVKKGDTELLEKLNQGLLIVKTNRVYEQIYDKWFTVDDPWLRVKKYLLPATIIMTAISLIAGIWLLTLQRIIQKRNSEIAMRKKAEEALLQSENKLRATLDATPFPIAVVDLQDDKILTWSRSALALFGHTAPTASEWYRIAYPDPNYRNEVIERWKPFLDIARESGQPVNTGEYRVTCRDGSIRICELYVTCLPDAIIVTFNDITGRKQAEAAMLNEKKFSEAIIESIPGMLYVYDDQGTHIRHNKRHEDMTGYSSEELFQLNPLSWYDNKADIVRVEAAINDVFTKGYGEVEVPMRIKTGEKRMMHFTASKLVMNGNNYFVGVGTDITERKLAEKALRETSEVLTLFIRHSPVYCYIKDVSSTRSIVLQASDNFQQMIGIPGSEMIGRTMEELFSPEIAAKIAADDWTVVSDGEILNLDEELNGRSYTTIKFPIVQGGKTLLAGYTIDITERKRIEAEKAELEAQNWQLQKTESLGRMAGAIAHHFNNQLYVVLGNLEMAMDDLPLGVNSNENLVSAMQAARKAADVSRLMLTYLGQTPGKHEPMNLSEVCRTTLMLLQAAAPKGILLNVDFPSSGPVVRADAGQIQQVLTNLITNAWEATGENQGAVALTVKTVSQADIPTLKRFPIDWQPQEFAYACIEVSDTGCGMEKKDIEMLFDPFFATKFTGRGLGLAVVLGIVKAHHGVITVNCEPGLGSVFRVFLPVLAEDVLIGPVKVEKSPEIKGSGTVLLIEDEEQVRHMAKIMLIRLGYTVLEAKDGVEALEIFQKHQDDVRFVLSDLTMPRMGGWDTMAALRNLSPDIPVILSSGYNEAQVVAEEHPDRPNAFLGKPYRLKELCETITHVLSVPVHL